MFPWVKFNKAGPELVIFPSLDFGVTVTAFPLNFSSLGNPSVFIVWT
jgi:hypothetical protein